MKHKNCLGLWISKTKLRKESQSSNKTHRKNEIPHQAVSKAQKDFWITLLESYMWLSKHVHQLYQLASMHVLEMARSAKGKQKPSEYTSHEYFPVSTAEGKIKELNK